MIRSVTSLYGIGGVIVYYFCVTDRMVVRKIYSFVFEGESDGYDIRDHSE